MDQPDKRAFLMAAATAATALPLMTALGEKRTLALNSGSGTSSSSGGHLNNVRVFVSNARSTDEQAKQAEKALPDVGYRE